MAGSRVDIHALRKSYEHGGRTIEVLKGIDLSIAAGEMVAVVGSSGVGKSTFLHVLGTLDQPSAGSIDYDGQDVTRMPPAKLADFRNHTIGFVFQFHHLLPEFTAAGELRDAGADLRHAPQRRAVALGQAARSRGPGPARHAPARRIVRAASSSAWRWRAR